MNTQVWFLKQELTHARIDRLTRETLEAWVDLLVDRVARTPAIQPQAIGYLAAATAMMQRVG